MKESKEKDNFLKDFINNEAFKEEKKVFDKIFGRPRWLLIELFNKSKLPMIYNNLKGLKCSGLFEKKVKLFCRKKRLSYFFCPCGKKCMIMPIQQGEKIHCFLCLVHLRSIPDEQTLNIFLKFTENVIRDTQREYELNKLYETIRQKQIALSTIHTIHRLLGSVLNLEELLKRIARLIQQIINARYCSIKIFSNDKSFLISKASIYKTKEIKGPYRRFKVGYGIEGICAAKGRSFLSKKFITVPLISEDVIGIITVKDKLNRIGFDRSDLEILSTLAEQATVAIKNAQLYEEQEKMLFGSIKALANLLDSKSPNTYTHSELFVRVVLGIAEELKLSREEIRNLHYSALLPDAGKLGVPEEILKKPSGLSGKEYRIVKRHPLDSAKIIQPIEVLRPVIPIILHHHERFDGSGYPDGLSKDRIPIGSRIMAVVDAFEAMLSQRPYRGATTISEAIKEIKKNSGTQFDPNIVNAFLKVIKKLKIKY